jgi:uncharacterized membrane protein
MTKKQQYFYFSLLAIKIVLGILFINRLSIDLDEPFSIFHAQKDLDQLNRLFLNENNPPLHFWLLHFWIKAFGIEPWAVRSLSFMFSVLTIPVLLQIGTRIKNTQVGLTMVALFVLSNFHHSFGLEARTYALFSFLFGLAVLLLVYALERKTLKISLFFGIILALLFYTHYMALVVVPVFIFVFFIYGLRNKFKENISYTIPVLLVFFISIAPVLRPFLARMQHVQNAGTWVPKPAWTELYGFINKFMNGPGFLVFTSLFVVYLFVAKKTDLKVAIRKLFSEKMGGIVLLTGGIYFGSFVISLFAVSSVFLDRYLFFVSIGIFALVAWFVNEIKPALGNWSWIPVLAVVFGFNPLKTHNRASDELAVYAAQFRGSYIISPPYYDLTFMYHFNREAFGLKLEGLQLKPFHVYPIYSLDELNLDEIRKPLVLVDAASLFAFGEQKLKKELMESYELIESKQFPGDYEVLVFDDLKQ